ncbi:hypothetical protein SDC9_46121 [bioreactor metagenome]|uniref:Uncharacterized protein n=1 Tax=bioreactor metagenome TaxID=1076179 RepID=A0A644W8U8_9ZZZZ
MPLRLARDGGADRRDQGRVIVRAGAQRRAQIGAVLLAEAHEQFARAGHPHPVAAFAEIVAQRRDEAEALAGLGQPHIARRPARAFSGLGDGEALGQPRAQVGQRPVLLEPLFLAHLAHRHHLDEGQVMPLGAAPVDEGEKLVLVEALQRDGVDLHPQPRPGRGADPLEHRLEAAPAGDLGEFRRVERVERDVHPPHPEGCKVVGKARKLRAVRGQRQLVERAGLEVPRHRGEKAQDPAPHQRLAPGHPQLAHAEPDEAGAQPVELLEGEQLLLRQELHVLGHAVAAAKVATVGDRHPQIGDRSCERVDEGRGFHARPDRARGPARQARAHIRVRDAAALLQSAPPPPSLRRTWVRRQE